MTTDIDTSSKSYSDSVDYENLSRLCLYDGKIKPVLIGRNILNTFFENNFLVTEDKTIWKYNGNGIYKPDGEKFIVNQIQNILGINTTTYLKNETINYIKDLADLHISYTDFNNKPNLINLNNGVYDIDSKEFKEHNPNYLFTTNIPITYNPNADCLKIKEFLNSILKQEDIPIIQELVGYLLLKDYRFHKAFMFLGSGRNGKSTLIELFKRFIGEDNVSNIDLQSIDNNRFASSCLYNKRLNSHSDISDVALKNTGIFKQLTGGDRIYADKKFQEPIPFTNYAKLIFSCNTLPKSYDDNIAFYSRWIIIEFDKVFEGKNCNPYIINEITTEAEMSGFFNFAIEGLNRLLTNKGFSHSYSTDEVKERWIKHSHPLVAFINSMVEINPNYEVSKTELYNAYKGYCDELDKSPIANNVFSREIKRHISKIDSVMKRVDDKQTRFWKGIRLRVVDVGEMLNEYPIKLS